MMTSMIQNDTNDNEYAAADNDEYDDNDATYSLSSAAADDNEYDGDDDDEYDDDGDDDDDDDDDNRSFISIFPSHRNELELGSELGHGYFGEVSSDSLSIFMPKKASWSPFLLLSP